jgi:hypothetical protein
VRRVRGLEDAKLLEPQALPELVKQRSGRSEDDRGDLDLELVHQACLQRLLRDAGAAADADRPVAGVWRARSTAASTPSTNSKPDAGSGWSATRWVTTTQGTPKGVLPPEPSVTSYMRRPTKAAPAPISSSSTSRSTPVAPGRAR